MRHLLVWGSKDWQGIRAHLLRVMCPCRRVLTAPIEALSRLNLDYFSSDIHLKSRFLLRRIYILCHPYEETRFADAAITKENRLVVLACFRIGSFLAPTLRHSNRLGLLSLSHGSSGLGLP